MRLPSSCLNYIVLLALMIMWTATDVVVCVDLLEFLYGPRLGSHSTFRGEPLQSAEFIVASFGYELKTYEVTTNAGFILTLHRIVKPKYYSKAQPSSTLLIHHGVLGSSDMWFFRSPQQDLPYLAADAGYDVWLSNARGNYYSRKHKILNPDLDADYWDFGIHELGYYDLPVLVDFILEQTNQTDLIFIGHSMGASIGLIMCSSRPEYNSKIRFFLALAPLSYVVQSLGIGLKSLMAVLPSFVQILKDNNIFEFFPRRRFMSDILGIICHNGMPTQYLCSVPMFMLVGVDNEQFNTTLFQKLFQFYPAGTSVQLIFSVLQYYQTGNFARYDFGNKIENFLHYNSSYPPKYDLSKVTVPISLHYGKGDMLVREKDVQYLASKLPNVVGQYLVPFKHFNHLDFVFATDTKYLLYDLLIELCNKYK